MENASKGLLIAAGVLIAIILVTISIKILNPTKSVIEDSEQLGSAISSSSSDAVDKFEASIGGKWTQDKTIVKRGSLILEVGDYINYDAGVSGYTGKWRILGVENGKLLILSNIIGNRYNNIGGADACKNLKGMLNQECIKYGTGKGAVSARPIEIEDVDRITGYNPTQYQKGKIDEYGNLVTYKWSADGTKIEYNSTNGLKGSYTKPQSFKNLDGVELKEGDSMTFKSTYYNYKIKDYIGIDTNAYQMLCEGGTSFGTIAISTSKNSVSFARSFISTSLGEIQAFTQYTTSGSYGSTSIQTRAVVYLKSDIQLQKNGDIWEIV